ncbi:hypothetical protein [Planctomicrobium piriforme]|uniref:Carboxypeptidase regulatory-like domain-containing protein n=1 Tax=Planctomicrobium piriforme TaxID=1576369 RepID=A0A1I3RFR0_9PLAN|nr:hypothetical protein [Planctomicrobium piriforme]SFJ44016.1 hypothetical protein SAMN05421753_12088 [Planctomicrobium piriforme]
MNARFSRWGLLALALMGLASGCGSKGDGLVKHHVSGEVKVNGVPRKAVVVALRHTDPSVKGNAAEPIAKTDESGLFRISTNGTGDGAVEGEYIVTFTWVSGDGTKDFLKGKYSKADKSEFRLQVAKDDLEPLTYELTALPEDVAAALADQEASAAAN